MGMVVYTPSMVSSSRARGVLGVTVIGSRADGQLPYWHQPTDDAERVDFEAAWWGVEFAQRLMPRLGKEGLREPHGSELHGEHEAVVIAPAPGNQTLISSGRRDRSGSWLLRWLTIECRRVPATPVAKQTNGPRYRLGARTVVLMPGRPRHSR
jgi:hypothetical protein